MVHDIPATWRAIFDALPDGVILHRPEGGIVFVNAAFAAFVGDANLVGRSVLDVVYPDEHDVVRRRIRTASQLGVSTEPRIFRFVRPDGSTVDGDCRGMAYEIEGERLLLVVVRDLTERQRAERALERSEALFRTLIEDLRIGVLVQGPSAEILVSNRAALELLGLDEAQLLGRTSFDPGWNVIHEDGSPFPGPEHPVPIAIRTRRPVRDVLMGVHRPKRGDRVWLLVNAEPQLDAEGNVVKVVCTLSDLTERRRLQEQSAASERLASMGRLAASVAHEMNNPLAYVIGHLETLSRAPLDAELQRRAREALEGANRVRAIVNDLRGLSRGDDERRGPVDFVRVVESACNIAAPHVRHRSRLVRDFGPIPAVLGNESRLGQLVLNLLVNAADAIPEGRAAENEIRIVLRTDARGWLVLEVSDTGAGIPPNVIDRIFEPFFTTKPVGVGTGLGLAICHDVVRSVGGTITAESAAGKGATFRVTLPPCDHVDEKAAAPQSSAVARARVLIIDDEPRVGRVLAELLRGEHDVDIEVDARDALDRLLHGARYDVIFCDLMMPNVTGMDFQRELEARVPELAARTVFMTGGAFTPRARAFIEQIGGRTLEKPFRIDEVTALIARVGRLGSAAREP
jgi:PAS domain S-box-containing protein